MVRKHKKNTRTQGAKHSTSHDLVARPKKYKVKPHHAKPYRFRHFGLLAIALILLLGIVFQTGVIIGASRQTVVTQTPTPVVAPQLRSVKSSYGFSFSFNDTVFKASATSVDAKGAGQAVADADLASGKQINFASVRPKSGTVPAVSAATQFSIQVLPGTAELAALRANPANSAKTDGELAAQLIPVTSSSDFDVTKVSSATDTIGDGTPVFKTTYQYTPKFSGGVSYAVVWNGSVNGRPFAVKLGGLLNTSSLPTEYQDTFTSLRFEGNQKVQGVSFSPLGTAYAASPKLDAKYLSDSVSPAVVKIYHVVCGSLVIGSSKTDHFCDGMTGSGFFVSSDGYIATNGHVAVLTAKDILVEIVTSSPENILSYLESIGLTQAQIDDLYNNPQQLASIIAKIYDMPDDKILLDEKKEVTLVAIGKTPLTITKDDTLDSLIDTQDSDSIKRADVVGFDYSGKDLLVASSGDPQGFSSSDVALLKIKTADAPIIPIIAGQMTQNEKITVLGFPGDAENSLVDNSKLDVSVTNGAISAIKEAAGGKAKLYQSDVDASHGNSGGPAINEAGEVFGLLTYRIAGDSEGNAAKSYMRDIADFSKLVKAKNVTLNTKSTTQDSWQHGLLLYSQNHFSAAKKDFLKVKQAYPAHRLVAGYIDNADKQIAAGNDVKLISPVLIGGAGFLALSLVGVAIVLIVRHRSRHQAYVSQQPPTSSAGGVPPPQPGTPMGIPLAQPQPPIRPPSAPPTATQPASAGMLGQYAPAGAQPLGGSPQFNTPAPMQPIQPLQQPVLVPQVPRPQPVMDIAMPQQQPLAQPQPMPTPVASPTVITPTIINPTQQ